MQLPGKSIIPLTPIQKTIIDNIPSLEIMNYWTEPEHTELAIKAKIKHKMLWFYTNKLEIRELLFDAKADKKDNTTLNYNDPDLLTKLQIIISS